MHTHVVLKFITCLLAHEGTCLRRLVPIQIRGLCATMDAVHLHTHVHLHIFTSTTSTWRDLGYAASLLLCSHLHTCICALKKSNSHAIGTVWMQERPSEADSVCLNLRVVSCGKVHKPDKAQTDRSQKPGTQGTGHRAQDTRHRIQGTGHSSVPFSVSLLLHAPSFGSIAPHWLAPS